MASFYKTLNHLRRTDPALSADASFSRVIVGEPRAVYAYVRKKGTHRLLVVLNLSGVSQQIHIPEYTDPGDALNIFLGSREKIGFGTSHTMEPWGYAIYDYDPQ
jgi:alpha-amylase